MRLAYEDCAMENHARIRPDREHGFSLVEMVVVVAIVAVMAAVALPNIGGYIRNYTIRGAAQDVAGEIQAARSKAIMSNTNNGVFFAIVDANSYRWIMADNPAGEQLGPLRDLPSGVFFMDSTEAGSGETMRFSRLGGFCNPVASTTTCNAFTADLCTPEELARCGDSAGGAYIEQDPGTGGGMTVRLLERSTSLERTVRIAPGGRVLPQP
jgi:prepilin-type N-terminal cleavage/methylation domain-containing protein